MKKFCAAFMAIVFSICLICPAFASSDTQYDQKADFWQWIAGKGSVLHDFVGYTFGYVCPESEDGYHHASSYQYLDAFFGQETGYYKCICTYCGEMFTAYETDLQQSYGNQVADLPATGITSLGHLVLQLSYGPHLNYFMRGSSSGSGYSVPTVSSESNYELKVNSLEFGKILTYSYASKKAPVTYSRPFCLYGSCSIPISGFYRMIGGLYCSYRYVCPDSLSREFFSYYPESTDFVYYQAGTTWYESRENYMYPQDFTTVTFLSVFASLYAPTFEIIPDTAISGDTYSIESRPTSITGGNYGIIGDNGQITQVTDNSTIVNETNNTYYNPATGETSTITDWSYDYSDRSYNLTLEGGDTSTVTYGDENITITETTINESGDIIINNYTIYYIIGGTGSENPPTACIHNWQEISTTPSTCTVPGSRFLACSLCNQTKTEAIPVVSHSWAETSTTPATCTVPGSRLLTCSLCNQTKTETIPALGHSWIIRQTVTTEYDDAGQLVQQGYTIFECTICGEQYKSTDGGAPPGGGSNTGSGSSGGLFSGIFGLLTDFLGFFWNTFHDFVGEGVKGFLSALTDGTSSIFGLLNPFSWGG